MIHQAWVKDLLASRAYSRTEKLLLCLAVEPLRAWQVRDVREAAVAAGLRGARKWNISQLLRDAGGLTVRTRDGWELTTEGRAHVHTLAGPTVNAPVSQVAAGLRHHLAAISNPDTRSFVEEAVRCYEGSLLRAAIVLSWVGAVSVLYDHVIAHHLPAFNQEATKKNPKWKTAVTRDDLARMKEVDFLEVLESMSVIGKSVKQELETALRLRNGAGHPNSLSVGEARVSGHVESLIMNVFAKF